MNDMIEPGADVATLPRASLPTILAADENDIFGKLFAELKDFKGDPSTERGRKEIISKAAKVSIAKQDLLRLGKRLKEDHIRIQKSIVAEEKVIEDRFDALRDQIREPVTAYENREKQRIAAHEAALAAITESENYGQTESAEEFRARLDYLTRYPARDWEEFEAKASRALHAEIDRIRTLLSVAEKREAEAAELIRLRAEEAERQRLADIAAQRAREEQIARDAAEAARKAAEAEAERLRVEAEERAQAQLRTAAEALARAEREKQEAIDKAERDRRAQEARAAQAALDAERATKAAEEKAERDRVAAVKAEQDRVAREAAALKAEEDRRAADKAHRATINRDVLTDLIQAIRAEVLGEKAETIARLAVVALAKGEVRHTRISY